MEKKIFDCFLFYNELELLELRLMELYPIVDYFILAESNKTFKNNEKELFFDKNKEKYAKYMDKIIHVKVIDPPASTESNIWVTEHFQRNAIMEPLAKLAKHGDKVILSDVDEIPNTNTILENINNKNTISFRQNIYYYYVNCKLNRTWDGPVMSEFGLFQNIQGLRNISIHNINPVNNGGWHYSFMGGEDKIINKVKNTSDGHTIEHLIGSKEEIKHKINNQIDLWNRTDDFVKQEIVDITNDAPKSMPKFLEKYPHFYFKKQ